MLLCILRVSSCPLYFEVAKHHQEYLGIEMGVNPQVESPYGSACLLLDPQVTERYGPRAYGMEKLHILLELDRSFRHVSYFT